MIVTGVCLPWCIWQIGRLGSKGLGWKVVGKKSHMECGVREQKEEEDRLPCKVKHPTNFGAARVLKTRCCQQTPSFSRLFMYIILL